MAAPKKFKDSDIIKAANEINKAGKNINGTSLRKLIGAGRPDALLKMYNDLLIEGKITVIEEATEVAEFVEIRELPKEVEQSLDDAVIALKNVVMQCNDIAHNTVENRLSAAIEKAKAAEVFAAEEVEKSEADLTAAFDEIEQLKEESQLELDLLTEKITSLTAENLELASEFRDQKKISNNALDNVKRLEKLLSDKNAECVLAEQEAIVQKTRTEETSKQLTNEQERTKKQYQDLEYIKEARLNDLAEIDKLKSRLELAESNEKQLTIDLKTKSDVAQNALLKAAKNQGMVDVLGSSELSLKEKIEALELENRALRDNKK
jgi:hypothetical protein